MLKQNNEEKLYAVICDCWGGLRIYNLNNITKPKECFVYESISNPSGFVIENDYIYLTDRWLGLKIIDISTPPEAYIDKCYYKSIWIEKFKLKHWHWDGIIKKDNTLIFLDGKGVSVGIIDKENNFELVKRYRFFDVINKAQRIQKFDNYAILSHGRFNGISLLNISNPLKKIKHLWTHDIDDFTLGAFIYEQNIFEQNIYAASSEEGVIILECKDTDNPKRIYTFKELGLQVSDVIVKDDYAYIADFAAIIVLDVSNTSNPKKISEFKTMGKFNSLYIHENKLICTNNCKGVVIFDIKDPKNLKEIGNYYIPGNPIQAEWYKGYIYVIAKNSGLWIIK